MAFSESASIRAIWPSLGNSDAPVGRRFSSLSRIVSLVKQILVHPSPVYPPPQRSRLAIVP